MKSIAIVSGKGGVGKTTTAINLAAHLNKQGKNILIIDANVNTPDIGLSLGAPVVPIALQHVLAGKNKPEDAIYSHACGTKIMPSSLSFNADITKLEKITNQLKNSFDYILIDSAAGLGIDAISAIKASDACLIVTNAELPALTGALKTIAAAKKLKKNILGVLVTRKAKNQLSLDNIQKMLELPILGIIPEDSKVKQAQLERETLLEFPRSKAAKAYMKAAKKFINPFEKDDIASKIKDFIDNFKISIKFGK